MSHIPTSAMPQANASASETGSQAQTGSSSGSAFGQIKDKVREHPKTAAAAGVVVAGLAAAAAIPAIRGRSNRSESGKSRD